MGAKQSRFLSVTAPPRFPHFKALVEVAPGFWNVRAPFYVLGGINIGTHMSIVQVDAARYVALDCVELTATAAAELDELTDGGELLVAVLTTHPFHTLSIPDFHARYPASEARKWYGCPRHLIKCTRDASSKPIRWAGDLQDCAVRRAFEPALRLSIPAGAEFVDPRPPTRNHLACVLVLHVASGTVHVDDCLNWIENMGVLPRLAFGNRTLHFHPSLLFSGLHPTAEAPRQFKQWVEGTLLDSWRFERLVTAHNGILRSGAQDKVRELLKRTDEALRKRSIKNAIAEAEQRAAGAWDGKGEAGAAAPAVLGADELCQDCWSDVEIECG